jgi:pimeloyl-ACP methyl ester carboxylesterase
MNMSANFPQYPRWAAYLKERQPKTLILWGRNDPFFTPAATEALMQALPAADLRFFDGGHFVLDEYAYPIAQAIVEKFSGSNDAR